jgi:membrane-bound lytic murein transglycosylase D
MSFHNRTLVLAGLVLLALATISCEPTAKKRTAVAPPRNAVVTAPSPAPTTAIQPDRPRIVEQKPQPVIDPVEALLLHVEREYRAGHAEYTAGHLETAKRHFDRAVSLLLESPGGVRSDERLLRKFEEIVESVHALEMAALKEGDGFTAQNAEPAPIDEASEITFPVDPVVKARAEMEMQSTTSDLPLVLNDLVAGYINYFSSRGRPTLERAWTRAGRYRAMISRILAEEGVPQDLIYLAQAESGFHPLALSRVGARGMWQFMASRATEYGLQRNWWVDDRQDPEKATRAAARHLKDLYHQFGDWYLAMAAYNSGPGRVQQAVSRTGYADFWELYKRGVLPKETRNYVPIIVAVTIMAKNPAEYGLEHIEPEAALDYDTISVDYPLDLRLAAECVDTSVSVLQELNPSLLRITTPKDRTFELKLPAGTAGMFQEAIAAIPQDKRVLWRYHKVEPGDTLAMIAKKYKTSPAAILSVNSLPNEEIYADSKLIIPVTGRAADEVVAYSNKFMRYKVRRGDTLSSIAEQFHVSVAKLKQWNSIRGSRVVAGRTLRIYQPLGPAETADITSKSSRRMELASADASGRTIHTVRKGDTLFRIATAYNTTVEALRRANGLTSNTLHPGDKLVVSGTD